jgi:hypothetical protein
VIANCSLSGSLQTGLLMAAIEKNVILTPTVAEAIRSLQSDFGSRNRKQWAEFASLAGNISRNSLQRRLRGGGRGIRTPGTVSRTSVFKTDCFNHSHIPPPGNASGSISVYTAAEACTVSPGRFSNTLSAYQTRQRFSFTIGEPALQ